MKKLFLLLLLSLPFMVEAQNNVEYLSTTRIIGEGEPRLNKPEKGSHYLDRLTGIVWEKTGVAVTSRKWEHETDTLIIKDIVGGVNGKDGKDGVSIKGDKGDKGDKGEDGICPSCPPTSGGGSSTSRIITSHLIEEFGTIVIGGSNSTKTVAEMGYSSANYPGYTISNTDQFDWANLQYGMYLEWQSGKKYQTYGTFRGVSKMVDMGVDNYYLVFEGTFAHFYTSNNNAFAVFGRPTPKNMTDANLMIRAQYHVENLNIYAQSNQIGFQPQPTYTSKYSSINVTGAKTGIWLQFNLNSTISSSMLTDCMNGVIIDMLDATKTAGATSANSQSNHSSADHIRVYGVNGEIGFATIASSGTSFIDCIVEGGKYKTPYYVDGKFSTVVKNARFQNNHDEGVYGGGLCGSGEAKFKIRGLAGTVTIDDIYAQYTGCAIDAASVGAAVNIHLAHSNWLVTPSDGKLFYNGGTTIWHLDWNTIGDIMNPANVSSRFAGTPVNSCGGFACGTNKWWLSGLGVINGGASQTAAREAESTPEPEPRYTVTFTIDKIKFMKFHPFLREKFMEEWKSNVYKVETMEEANMLITANPDFIATITE